MMTTGARWSAAIDAGMRKIIYRGCAMRTRSACNRFNADGVPAQRRANQCLFAQWIGGWLAYTRRGHGKKHDEHSERGGFHLGPVLSGGNPARDAGNLGSHSRA